MSKQSNRDYYAARVATELALAAASPDETIAALHSELANRYADLLASMDEQPVEMIRRTANC